MGKRLLFLVFIVLNISSSKAQNFVLLDGEYMDTVMNMPFGCSNYNAYYYQVGGKYPENSYSILKNVQNYLQLQKNTYLGNGYITFRFSIDCAGKMVQKVQVCALKTTCAPS